MYDGFLIKSQFLHFVNRVLSPIVWLKNQDDVDKFLNVDEEFVETTDFFKNKWEENSYLQKIGKKTRVIGFFHDKKDYGSEFSVFKSAA